MTLQRDTDLFLSPPRGRFRVGEKQNRVWKETGMFSSQGSHDVKAIPENTLWKQKAHCN